MFMKVIYAKEPYKAKYQFLINKQQITAFNAFEWF